MVRRFQNAEQARLPCECEHRVVSILVNPRASISVVVFTFYPINKIRSRVPCFANSIVISKNQLPYYLSPFTAVAFHLLRLPPLLLPWFWRPPVLSASLLSAVKMAAFIKVRPCQLFIYRLYFLLALVANLTSGHAITQPPRLPLSTDTRSLNVPDLFGDNVRHMLGKRVRTDCDGQNISLSLSVHVLHHGANDA